MNPAKISGNCGRLLCCLRYEVGLYTKVKSRFPSHKGEVPVSVGGYAGEDQER